MVYVAITASALIHLNRYSRSFFVMIAQGLLPSMRFHNQLFLAQAIIYDRFSAKLLIKDFIKD